MMMMRKTLSNEWILRIFDNVSAGHYGKLVVMYTSSVL